MTKMRKRIHEAPQEVNQSLYTSVNFKDGVVGDSAPSRDKINPSLLADIEEAAKKVGVTASVTTAVSGHRSGSRHETGHAVDIAMFDGKGFSSKADAEKKGILQSINSFVQALSSMGYVINSESGNDKAVLTFGFPNHDNHVHVSRKSDNGGEGGSLTKTEKKTDTTTDKKTDTTTTQTTKSSDSSSSGFTDTYGIYDGLSSMITPLTKVGDELKSKFGKSMSESKINEEINRIKQIMKS
jgi:hypothetical protein